MRDHSLAPTSHFTSMHPMARLRTTLVWSRSMLCRSLQKAFSFCGVSGTSDCTSLLAASAYQPHTSWIVGFSDSPCGSRASSTARCAVRMASSLRKNCANTTRSSGAGSLPRLYRVCSSTGDADISDSGRSRSGPRSRATDSKSPGIAP